MPKLATEPPRRTATVRDALVAALRESPATSHEISTRVGIRERDVAEHLEHVRRTLEARGEALQVDEGPTEPPHAGNVLGLPRGRDEPAQS